MFAESRAGFFRAREADLSTVPGWPLEHLAQGARLVADIFGEPSLGTLRPGAPADICVLDYDTPAPLDGSNLAGHWVFGFSPAKVRDVYVAGRLVVSGGRSTRVDEAKEATVQLRVCEEMWRRLGHIPPHEFEPKGLRP